MPGADRSLTGKPSHWVGCPGYTSWFRRIHSRSSAAQNGAPAEIQTCRDPANAYVPDQQRAAVPKKRRGPCSLLCLCGIVLPRAPFATAIRSYFNPVRTLLYVDMLAVL